MSFYITAVGAMGCPMCLCESETSKETHLLPASETIAKRFATRNDANEALKAAMAKWEKFSRWKIEGSDFPNMSLEEQIAYMEDLQWLYFDHMEGTDLTEFLYFEKLYLAASTILEAMHESLKRRSDKPIL